MNVYVCVVCGITSLDGAPEYGIPYARVEMRENAGCEILCDWCEAKVLEDQKDTGVTLGGSKKL
jgi:hypothetical protein